MPPSVSRAMVLPTTLTTPRHSAPFSLAFAQGGEGVGGFAGLADGDDDGPLFHQRIAIAEFAGVGAFGDDLGEIFHQIIADQAGMPGGALAGEDESAGAGPGRGCDRPGRRGRSALRCCSARPRRQLPMAVGLLEDLLEHVMLVVAQLVFFELVFQLLIDGADVDVVDGGGA